MLDWLLKAFRWFVGFWSELPKEKKDEIMNTIIEKFEGIFRSYFKNNQNNQKEETNE